MLPLMIFHAAIAWQATTAPPRLIIVGEKPFEDRLLAKFDAEPLPATLASLTTQGYVRVDQEGMSFLFAPSIWGERRLAERLGVWQDFAKAIQEDGTVHLKDAPQLTRYLNDRLSGMSYEVAPDSLLVYSTQSTVTIEASGTSRRISYSGSRRHSSELHAAPLRSLDPQKRHLGPEFGQFGVFVPPAALSVYSPGRRSLDPVQRMDDTSQAAILLAKRFEKARAELAAVRASLAARFPSLAVTSGVVKGTPFDRLPAGVQSQIAANLVGGYLSAGFADEDSAQAWVSKAHVASFSTAYLITGAGPLGAGSIGIGLP